MSTVGQCEIHTRNAVVSFFGDALDYAYLGHWKDRERNSDIEQD